MQTLIDSLDFVFFWLIFRFRLAFGCAQHPKAGRNTQHWSYLYLFLSFCMSVYLYLSGLLFIYTSVFLYYLTLSSSIRHASCYPWSTWTHSLPSFAFLCELPFLRLFTFFVITSNGFDQGSMVSTATCYQEGPGFKSHQGLEFINFWLKRKFNNSKLNTIYGLSNIDHIRCSEKMSPH